MKGRSLSRYTAALAVAAFTAAAVNIASVHVAGPEEDNNELSLSTGGMRIGGTTTTNLIRYTLLENRLSGVGESINSKAIASNYSTSLVYGGSGGGGGSESPRPLRLPNVLLIGAQKAGSSALSQWLFGLGVCRARTFNDEPSYYRKEVHFFDLDERYERGAEFYAKRFRHCSTDGGNAGHGPGNLDLMMDATPSTMLYANRVRSTYEEAGHGQADKVKILVILREPVARELSLYNHMTYKYRHRDKRGGGQAGKKPYFQHVTNVDGSVISFADYVDRVTLPSVNATDGSCGIDRTTGVGNIACRGLYAHYLKEWMNLFNRRRQILVLSYDELRQNEEALMGRVLPFLGLDDAVGHAGSIKAVNTKQDVHKVDLPPCHVQDRLGRAFASANDALRRLLGEFPGPEMEQRPFPRFALSNCSSSQEEFGISREVGVETNNRLNKNRGGGQDVGKDSTSSRHGILHIISSYAVNGCDERYCPVDQAQSVALESMRRARKHATKASVTLTSVVFPKDETSVSIDFVLLANLTRSTASKFPNLSLRKELPFLGDIFDSVKQGFGNFSSFDYVIYTNADIILHLGFYDIVAGVIEDGHDAFTINRQTVPSIGPDGEPYTYSDLDTIYQLEGTEHPGSDCFVMETSVLERIAMGDLFVGFPITANMLLVQVENLAKNFRMFESHSLRATFHLGDAREWKEDTEENNEANRVVLDHAYYDLRNIWSTFCHFSRNGRKGRIVGNNWSCNKLAGKFKRAGYKLKLG